MIRLGLIGEHVDHSVSPKIHQCLLNLSGVAGTYEIVNVPKDELPGLLQRLAEEGYAGLNVTTPYKQSIVEQLVQVDDGIERLQAVNTIVLGKTEEDDMMSSGYNTDVAGFWNSLPQAVCESIPEKNVLLLGAGGASRAVLAALLPHQPKAITIAGKTPERLEAVAQFARDWTNAVEESVVVSETPIGTVQLSQLGDLSGFDLLINATPMGTGNMEESPIQREQLTQLPKQAFVYDLVYHPKTTRLLADAASCGLSCQNGMAMLIYQAIESFNLWTMRPLPQDAYKKVNACLLNN